MYAECGKAERKPFSQAHAAGHMHHDLTYQLTRCLLFPHTPLAHPPSVGAPLSLHLLLPHTVRCCRRARTDLLIVVCIPIFGVLFLRGLLHKFLKSLALDYQTIETMPVERAPTKASENRRATKPIMEKRRRARINQCLSELKALILDALNKDPSRHSKLEKADILEMTVRHLQNIQRQQMASAISSDPSVLNKFKAGFNECATEVNRYVNRMEGVDPALRQRLLSHLSNCLTTMNSATAFPQATVGFPGFSTAMMTSPLQSLSVQIPGALTVGLNNPNRDMNNNNSNKIFNGLSLIPSRLPNGDLAFLLPSQALTNGGASQIFGLPSGSSSSLPSSSGAERTSNSSWPPSSPMSPVSSRRSASPVTSEHSALSPTGSDGGSDVFIEPYKQRDTVLSTSSRLRQIYPLSDNNQNQHHNEPENVWRPW